MKQNPCSQKSRCRFTSQHPLWGQCWHHAIGELLQQHLVEHHKIVVSSVHWALESLQWRKEEDQSIHSLDSSTCTIFFGAANTISSLAQFEISSYRHRFVTKPFRFHCHMPAFVQSSGFKQVNLQIILHTQARKAQCYCIKSQPTQLVYSKSASPSTSKPLKTLPAETAKTFLRGYILSKPKACAHYLAGNLIFHMFQKKALLLRYKLHLYTILAQ